MVRLKVPIDELSTSYTVFQFLMVRLKDTSRLVDYFIYLFQFLMVRLKDGIPCARVSQIQVSIPYGTIKSK